MWEFWVWIERFWWELIKNIVRMPSASPSSSRGGGVANAKSQSKESFRMIHRHLEPDE